MTDQELIEAAIQIRDMAYAPYSQFRIGAAVLLSDKSVHTGVNVENCSYGLTVCAERNAIAAAVAAGAGPGTVQRVAIVSDAQQAASPCGACRQVLAEFALPTTEILLHNLRDQTTTTTKLGELLPRAFVRSSLGRP